MKDHALEFGTVKKLQKKETAKVTHMNGRWVCGESASGLDLQRFGGNDALREREMERDMGVFTN